MTETQAPPGFLIDTQSQTVQIKEGRTVSLTFKNQPKGELIIQKRDSTTGRPLLGAEFRVTTAAGCEVGLDGVIGDSTLTQNGIFITNSAGEIHITNLAPGAYVISEIKAPQGYVMDQASTNVVIGEGGDTQTVVITNSKAGTLIIDKRDSLTGEPLEGVTFKVTTSTGEFVPDENGYISSNGLYKTDKDGKIQIDGVVGTLVVTETATIPGYKIVESKAADFYGLDQTPIEVEIEYAGQIVKAAMTNKSLYTNVSIKKTGYVEVMPGQQIRYDFSGIGNNSTTSLTSFYWRDTLPTQAVRLDKIVTGTYNVPGNYKVVYKTNLNPNYRTMYDNLSTQQNYVLDASPAALGLAFNEVITEFMMVFGVVPANFRQVEAPQVYCNVVSWLTGGTQFVNQADVGGVYNGQWIMATSRWVTKVYKPAEPLPRTGY